MTTIDNAMFNILSETNITCAKLIEAYVCVSTKQKHYTPLRDIQDEYDKFFPVTEINTEYGVVYIGCSVEKIGSIYYINTDTYYLFDDSVKCDINNTDKYFFSSCNSIISPATIKVIYLMGQRILKRAGSYKINTATINSESK